MAQRKHRPKRDPRQMSLWDWTPPVDASAVPVSMVRTRRASTGAMGHAAGASAELRVAQDYERRGYPIARTRWRGKGGEIDLIAQDGDAVVFVEVKQSRTFDRAVARLGRRQIARLQSAAEEYLGTQPNGALTEMRFDVALVNGFGEMRVIENALMDW
ncbi:YraN family protein [Sagittula sp. SSi028]|uniref:YraN family protein n=1 Tax=Sagittula sp. SSi028 TaxID=3400636 RepID=UPI003AF89764